MINKSGTYAHQDSVHRFLLWYHSGSRNGPRRRFRSRRQGGKQTVADTPFVIVAPSEEIVVTFPLFFVERGVVESVDVKNGTFTIKDKQGQVSTIKVTDNTLIENVYVDIFTWETKKGINDLKKGDKIRARVLPGDDGQPASAISLDVYKF